MTEKPLLYHPASFRDRSSRVLFSEARVFRLLDEKGTACWEALQKEDLFTALLEESKVIPTWDAPSEVFPDEWMHCLEHDVVPFISYPYEWSFSCFQDAALLQLELLERSLKKNFILKDSTPYNFQFWKGRLALIDIGSFEVLEKGSAWRGYKQFCELFLYPLLLQHHLRIPFQQLLRASLEGVTAEVCNNMLGGLKRFRPSVFLHVYLQQKLQASYKEKKQDVEGELKQVGFQKELIEINVRKLRRLVTKLQSGYGKSTWSHYADELPSYTPEEQKKKQTFVESIVSAGKWKLAWDLGANTGTFSKLVAPHAETVLALDADAEAIERLYLDAKRPANVTPLVMNLADPSPACGWQARERSPLWERGRPDLILCLALIHHMVISSHIPLEEFVDWLASLSDNLAIEFVSRKDPMVKRLLMQKGESYLDYNQEGFEARLQQHFRVEKREVIADGMRTLYFARRQ